MKRDLMVALASTCAIISAPPSLADSSTASNNSSLKKSPLLVRMAAVVVGATVGTPVCLVRKFSANVNEGAHQFSESIVGEEKAKVLLVPSAVIWSPFAAMLAMVEAPWQATANACQAKEPFSKEQFSLGENVENN